MYGWRWNLMTGKLKKIKIKKINRKMITISLPEMFSMMTMILNLLKKSKRINQVYLE